MKVFDGKEGWKGRTILNKCYSDFLQEFRSLIKRKFTSVLKKIRQPKKNWHLNCLIIFKWSFLFDFKSSQFSHKQLVLVTAPVSTGAYLLKKVLPVLKRGTVIKTKRYPAVAPDTSATISKKS